MKALIDHCALFCLLLVFMIKVIGSNGIRTTLCLPVQLSLSVPFNGLENSISSIIYKHIFNHFISLTGKS